MHHKNYPNIIFTPDDNDTSSTEETKTVNEIEGDMLTRTRSNGGYGEASGNAVSIENAVEEYESVRREMSRQSRMSANDPEKGEEFDLTQFLEQQHSELTEAGIKLKNMGVIWKNLTVHGFGPDARSILTNWSVVENTLKFWNWFKPKGTEVTILHDNDGFVKAGEMLLVLGRPGSGCSTLLRSIANMRSSFTAVEGDVTYGGIDAKDFGKHFKGEVCYNEEEDIHYPTLTTEETLRFALKTKTPSTRIPGESKEDFINCILYMLGNMLGLTKQMKTMVGNAFVRGLSGGERKRLSIAEQMTTHSSINCWDCSTRGLDASSALDYVRSLRIMTDIMHKTTISTLYQASDSIFELFNKVMIFDEGRCIYFGPVSEAKQYFVNLGFYCPPRKSTPDFLTGICNLNERQIRNGFEGGVPLNAAQFEKVYKESSIYKEMMAERLEYEQSINQDKPDETFREAFKQAHNTPSVVSYFEQIKALTVRQYQLIKGDKMTLYVRYGDVIAKGLILASVYYMTPLTAVGAFSRGGLILNCIIFNAFIAQSELPAFMQGRRVLEKHKQFAMYHPSAFYLSQVIIDIPLILVQVSVFMLCTYFIAGFALDAGKFFTMFINLIFLTLCMNGLFRLCGSASPNFYTASQVSSIFFIAFIIYSGYQIPYPSMHPWFFWIYWINPIAYSFKSMLSSELKGAEFSCDGTNGVPYGPNYTDLTYRTCSLPGAIPGASYVLGDDYLANNYAYYTSQIWINCIAVLLFFILFTVLASLAMEFISLSQGSTVTKVYKKGFHPTAESEESQLKQTTRQEEQKLEAVSDGTTFSWQHMNYTVPVKGGTRQLLNNVGGFVKPGHLTALMGSSGAGKTTLLDVLARRKTLGTVDGYIYMNGETLKSDFERLTGYCEQMDVHNPNATVREALQFSAYLRQPADVSKRDKDAYVEQILELLEMQKIGDALVGDLEEGTGISVEERKRLTIAVELVGKPKLLFLDEPTSGLDAQSSYNIIRFIRKLADAGWPVLCTIHQPSATLFEHFDHLLLLVRGGKTAYFGEIGENSSTMIQYFESHGGPICSPGANPAEYILECVGAGTSSKVTQDWAEIWEQSDESVALNAELDAIRESASQDTDRQVKTYSQPFWTQFYFVCQRMTLSWWRSPSYSMGRFFNVCFIGLITGFTFWKLGATPIDLQNRFLGLLTSMFMGHTFILLIQPRFEQERMWFRREFASRYYGWLPFAISCIVVEIPYVFGLSAIYLFFYYWTTGLENVSERVGYFYIQFSVYLTHSVTFGYAIAAFAESPTLSAIINPFFTTILYLFSGIFQPPSAMPRFWSSWIYWLDPYHYFIEGLVTNSLEGVEVVCGSGDWVKINIPPDQTCGEYMNEFFSQGGLGYIEDGNSIGYCNYCEYTTGNDYYESNLGWSYSNRWRNFGILWLFTAFNIAVFALFVFLRRKQKR